MNSMENFLEFVKTNYILFTIVSIILVLALIGYLVDTNVSKDVVIKNKNKDLEVPEIEPQQDAEQKD